MAITPTNSNTVNIANLPNAQLATPGDYLILQTANGTQVITFQNFNAVKTDIYGNATVIGDLSGGVMYLTGGVYTGGGGLSASKIWTAGDSTGYGYSYPGTSVGTPIRQPVCYDSFTIQNGLILSAFLGSTSTDGSGKFYYSNSTNPLYFSVLTQLTAASASIVNTTNSLVNTLTSTQNTTTSTLLTAATATFNTQIISLTAAQQTQIISLTAAQQTTLNSLTSTQQTQLTTLTGIYNNIVQNISSSNIIYDVPAPTVQVVAYATTTSTSAVWQNFYQTGRPTAAIDVSTLRYTDVIIALNPSYSVTVLPLSGIPYIRKFVKSGNDLIGDLCITIPQGQPVFFDVRLFKTA